MGFSEKLMQEVKRTFQEIHTNYPEIKDSDLYKDGVILYMNGNDSTDFDWDVNERTCEFMQFYEKTELGVAKIYVTSDGYICGFVYLDEGKGSAIELEPKYVGEVNARLFAYTLYKNADKKRLFDADINKINVSVDAKRFER